MACVAGAGAGAGETRDVCSPTAGHHPPHPGPCRTLTAPGCRDTDPHGRQLVITNWVVQHAREQVHCCAVGATESWAVLRCLRALMLASRCHGCVVWGVETCGSRAATPAIDTCPASCSLLRAMQVFLRQGMLLPRPPRRRGSWQGRPSSACMAWWAACRRSRGDTCTRCGSSWGATMSCTS
jgi:hypothetical protein